MVTVKRSLVAIAFTCILSAPSRGAITLQSFDADSHNRFNDSPTFAGSPFDWSGVGQTSSHVSAFGAYWGTIISPSYFVSANHYRPPVGSTLRFYLGNDSSGAGFEERTVLNGWQIVNDTFGPSDLWLGKLSSPVSAAVAKYPILSLPSLANYNSLTISTFGLSTDDIDGNRADDQRLGRNNIDPGTIGTYNLTGAGLPGVVANASFTYDFDNPGGVGADESLLQLGDSGGPSFVLAGLLGDTPAIVGTHTAQTGVPVGSLDTFVPFYTTDIFNRINTNGDWATDSFAVVTAVPEPGALAFLGTAVVIGGSVVARRRWVGIAR